MSNKCKLYAKYSNINVYPECFMYKFHQISVCLDSFFFFLIKKKPSYTSLRCVFCTQMFTITLKHYHTFL